MPDAPSRTPEGSPGHCGVCGHQFRLSASWPGGDVPCPACGSLVWAAPPSRRLPPRPAPFYRWLRANFGLLMAGGCWLVAGLASGFELLGLGAPEMVALGVVALVLFRRGIR